MTAVETRRIDDFRCFDPGLAEVLPGREAEAVAFAREHGFGLFVLQAQVTDWSFLDDLSGIDRLEIVSPHASLREVALRAPGLRRFRLSNLACDLDFAALSGLEYVQFEWTPGCRGLEALAHLRDASIYDAGKPGTDCRFPLPGSLRELNLIQCRARTLDFGDDAPVLDRLHLLHSRQLRAVPAGARARALSLSAIGNAAFDYGSIPACTTNLHIEKGAAIEDWAFLDNLPALTSLWVERTRCPDLPASVRARIGEVEFAPFGR